MEELISNLISFLNNFFNPEVMIFIISMIPILELRGGLIAASLLKVDWYIALPICIVGNMLPIPFILLFIKRICEYMKTTKFSKIFNKLENKANKNSEKILKYERWGLFLFVAIPFPGTGAWTGALASSLLEMKIKNSFISIFLGILTAALIMTIFSYGLIGLIVG